MDKQDIVDSLKTLGEPEDGRPWADYSRYGISSSDASRLVALVKDQDGEFFTNDDEDDAYWVPLHAWRALKPLMPAGLEALIDGFHLFGEDDWALDEIPEVVAAAGNAAIAPLADFIVNNDNETMARSLAMGTLNQIGRTQPSLRAKVIKNLSDCLQDLPAEHSDLNGLLVSHLVEFKAVDTKAVIQTAFAEQRVDINICGDLEDVEIALGLRTERSTPRPDYQAANLELVTGVGDEDSADENNAPQIEQVRRTTPKVGRNEPCPCGSDKKYKKCCGAA